MKKSEEKLLTLEISIVKLIYEDEEFGDLVNYTLDCNLGEDNRVLIFDKKYPNHIIFPDSNLIKSYIMKYMHKFIKEYEKINVS